jgi:hypothetical protein
MTLLPDHVGDVPLHLKIAAGMVQKLTFVHFSAHPELLSSLKD